MKETPFCIENKTFHHLKWTLLYWKALVLKLHELSFSVKKKHFLLYLDPRSHISLRTTDAVLLFTKTKLSGHSSSIFTFRAENIQHMKKTHFCIVNKTLMWNEQFSFCQALVWKIHKLSFCERKNSFSASVDPHSLLFFHSELLTQCHCS